MPGSPDKEKYTGYVSLEDNEIDQDEKEIKIDVRYPDVSQEMERQSDAEIKISQTLDSIESTLNSTSTVYAVLRKTYRENFCNGKIMPLVFLGSIAVSAFCWAEYIDDINQYNVKWDIFKQYLNDGTCASFSGINCSYYPFFYTTNEVCMSAWENACSSLTTAMGYLGGGISGTALTLLSSCCYICHLPPVWMLTLEDYLQQNEIHFLANYGIKPRISITEAMESVKIIKDSRMVRNFLYPDLWKIVQDYLAPLPERETFDLAAIDKETKADSNYVRKLTTSEIIKRVQALDQIGDNLKASFEGFRDMKDAEVTPALYNKMLNQARQAQLLAATVNMYSEITKERVTKQIEAIPYHLPAREKLLAKPLTNSNDPSEAVRCNRFTNEIAGRLKFFAQNTTKDALDVRTSVRKLINQEAKVNKNQEAVKFLGFVMKK